MACAAFLPATETSLLPLRYDITNFFTNVGNNYIFNKKILTKTFINNTLGVLNKKARGLLADS